MNPVQAIPRVEYQFVGSTKEERVEKHAERRAQNSRPLMRDEYLAMLASGEPIYAVYEIDGDVVKIDTTSKGDRELTDEQLDYLRENYCMDNLTKADKMKLLGDLSCFGVISGEQALTEALMITYPQFERDRLLPFKSDNAKHASTAASELRGAGSFEAWGALYANWTDEYSEDIARLMSDPYADLSALQTARSKRDYYAKMNSIIGLISGAATA